MSTEAAFDAAVEFTLDRDGRIDGPYTCELLWTLVFDGAPQADRQAALTARAFAPVPAIEGPVSIVLSQRADARGSVRLAGGNAWQVDVDCVLHAAVTRHDAPVAAFDLPVRLTTGHVMCGPFALAGRALAPRGALSLVACGRFDAATLDGAAWALKVDGHVQPGPL
jgi:hypothetical protein